MIRFVVEMCGERGDAAPVDVTVEGRLRGWRDLREGIELAGVVRSPPWGDLPARGLLVIRGGWLRYHVVCGTGQLTLVASQRTSVAGFPAAVSEIDGIAIDAEGRAEPLALRFDLRGHLATFLRSFRRVA